MEKYSVKELQEQLVEKVSGLGIGEKFKENPAFASALSLVSNAVNRFTSYNDSQMIKVSEEDGVISFAGGSLNSDKYSVTISCLNPNSFNCITTVEKGEFFSKELNRQVESKNVIECAASIDSYGEVTIAESDSTITNDNSDSSKCNIRVSARRKEYDKDGVMKSREYKGYNQSSLNRTFEQTSINDMLYVPRQAFVIGGNFYDSYNSRELLVRKKLDTATYREENKTRGKEISYYATVPLNQENGLREMILQGGYENNPERIVIPAISQEQVAGLIKRESNDKIAKGLEKYAVGRENYSYDSATDINFVREGNGISSYSRIVTESLDEENKSM